MATIDIKNRPLLNDTVWTAKNECKPIVITLHLVVDGEDQPDWKVASTSWLSPKDAMLLLQRESDPEQHLRLTVRITPQSAVTVRFIE